MSPVGTVSCGVSHVELDVGAFEDGEGLVRHRSVDARVAGLDQALDPGAGEVIEGAREHGIEPSRRGGG